MPRNRERWRLSALLGVAFVLTGLGCLGYVGWQYVGTDVISRHQQAEVKKSLALDWGKGVDGDAVALLRVPRFGKDYEVAIVPGFGSAALAKGVGWHRAGAKPGQVGNFAIAAHRVTHGEPFRDFLRLREGDKVEVETRTKVFTYRLRNDGTEITVDFTATWPLQSVPVEGSGNVRPTDPVLTMLTCSELFHTRDRNVVLGDLVSTVAKDSATTGSGG